MTNRRAAILLIAGVVLLVAGLVGFLIARPALFPATSTPLPTATPIPTFAPPPLEFTPPPSLAELATQYPELAPILDDPELSSAYKEFLTAYQSGGVEAARALAKKRGILDDQDRLRATLELDTTDTAPIEAELKPYGVQVLGVYQNLMDIAMPLRDVEALAEISNGNPGAIFAKLTSIQHVVRVRLPNKNQPRDDPVVGEGVRQTGADLWHQAGITGKGIKVGVLDLGFKDYDKLLGSSLPQNVVAMSFVPGEEPQQSSEVHGTAVAEIVYEMAPDAELYLAYYDGGDVSFANAVDWLLSQGVNIISHSAGGSVGPMDGTETDAMIVDQVTARNILWVNASGNEAGNHYRGVFTDTDGDGWHEFPDGSNFMGILAGPSGAVAYLNWDDWIQLTQDFDLYMFDRQGNLIGASEEAQNGGAGQWAAEAVGDYSIPADTPVYVGIKAANATRAVTFDLYAEGFAVQFPVPDHSITHPGDAFTSFTIGAVEGFDNALADYSSQGPTNDGRMKPEISAPAGVMTVSYSPEPFHGTSASTPHVSGAAALVWSEHPEFTAEQVKQYLIQNALDLRAPGPDNETGYGALYLPPPPGVTPPAAPGAEAGAATGAAAVLFIALCGGFFLCGFALVLVGGIALVAGFSRRSRPAPARPAPTSPALPTVPSATSQARLILTPGHGYDLNPGGMTLGRAPECEIVLDNTQISRRHATIRWGSAGWTIIDLGSSNGTFVNGQRLTPNAPRHLHPGDQILIGGAGGVALTFAIV